MLHGIGATLARRLGPGRLRVYPHPSALALACARLGWPEAEVELVSAVGRPADVLVRALQPGRRVVAYASGTAGASELARVLCARGFGPSRMVVLEQLGGPAERIAESTREGVGRASGGRAAHGRHRVPSPSRVAAGCRAPPGCRTRPTSTTARSRSGRFARSRSPRSRPPRASCSGTSARAAARSASSGCAPSRRRARSRSRRGSERAERAIRNARALGVPQLDGA